MTKNELINHKDMEKRYLEMKMKNLETLLSEKDIFINKLMKQFDELVIGGPTNKEETDHVRAEQQPLTDEESSNKKHKKKLLL